MNRINVFFIILLSVTTSMAAENATKKKRVPAQRVVVSKPWEPTAFIQSSDRLPADYSGIDTAKFFEMFDSKIGSLKKGEFETSEEFLQRTSNPNDLLAPINITDTYAFRIKDIAVKYDADKQSYEFGDEYGYKCTIEHSVPKDWVICEAASIHNEYGTYTASNAFGRSVTVRQVNIKSFGFAIQKTNRSLSTVFSQDKYLTDRYRYQDRVSVSLEKARGLKDLDIGVLFVGRIIDAKIVPVNSGYVKPTIDRPSELSYSTKAVHFDLTNIIYYVIQTGEIIEKRNF